MFVVPCVVVLLGVMPENAVFEQLTQQGLPVGETRLVKLPAPSMADGLDAAAQREVIARIAGQQFRVADLMRKSPVAPFVLKLDTIGTCEGGASLRSVDLWLIAYGRIEQLTSQAFLEDVVKTSAGGGLPSKVEVFDKEALARYGLTGEESPDRAQRYFYTTFPLLDRVQISVTRRAVLTKGDVSGIAAAIVARRFDGDATYGNQWQPIKRGPNGQLALGGPQPYHTGGFYAKVTRLAEPPDALFLEYHQVFCEPAEWFGGVNLLGSKIPLMVQDSVRTFRRKLAKP
jgi:hypothetical protein